jgi:hypothetical protein
MGNRKQNGRTEREAVHDGLFDKHHKWERILNFYYKEYGKWKLNAARNGNLDARAADATPQQKFAEPRVQCVLGMKGQTGRGRHGYWIS